MRNPFEYMEGYDFFLVGAILAIVSIVALALCMRSTDDRVCLRYGPPVYVKTGAVMVPIEQCAEYEEGE